MSALNRRSLARWCTRWIRQKGEGEGEGEHAEPEPELPLIPVSRQPLKPLQLPDSAAAESDDESVDMDCSSSDSDDDSESESDDGGGCTRPHTQRLHTADLSLCPARVRVGCTQHWQLAPSLSSVVADGLRWRQRSHMSRCRCSGRGEGRWRWCCNNGGGGGQEGYQGFQRLFLGRGFRGFQCAATHAHG
jgi:hypothetical protein